MNFAEADENAKARRTYEVTGSLQIRFETTFTENETSRLVKCFDLSGNRAGVEVEEFKQTSDAFINTLSADLTATIEKLLLQIGEHESLLNILNMEEIWENWKSKKQLLIEKHADIPDFDAICDNFGDNLKNEEKLLTSIRDKGIYGLLFPQLKHFVYGKPSETFERRKTIKEFAFTKDLPIAEKISIGQNVDNYLFEVQGTLDKENFDYDGFLHISRQMFGGQVKAEDVSFESSENYSLDKATFQYKSGSRRFYFAIKNAYFSDDRQQFQLKADG